MRSLPSVLNSLFLLIFILIGNEAYPQFSLHYSENLTPTYEEIIEFYQELDKIYPEGKLIEAGNTDAGLPLHLFIISKDELFTPQELRKADKRIIMVNNGIHPGECNGIDASLEFARDLLNGSLGLDEKLENTVLLIVPVFNIGGALQRSRYNRANQNGPVEQGFRGNARNLDLNRDFVKMDTRNARSMAQIIQSWDPDVFVDTHSTNGADYPYTVTLIPSHHQQLEAPQSEFLQNKMDPFLYEQMNASPFKMCHYVNVFRTTPEEGFNGFYEYPRYLCGYTSTYHILSFTVETHMLKPYNERVLSTKYLLEQFLTFVSNHSRELKKVKQEAISLTKNRSTQVLKWTKDTTRHDMIHFNGYTAKERFNELTGQDIVYYDQEDKWSDSIPFHDYFLPEIEVSVPEYYYIPQAWEEVIERLKASGIEMKRVEEGASVSAEIYFIDDFESTRSPYNGHYWHYNTKTRKETSEVKLREGDFLIPTKQRGSAYLVQTLEPEAYDSYFSWNFFDACLSRKEYFSHYLFVESAKEYLDTMPDVAREFNEMKADNPAFSGNTYAQLAWIYEHSPWAEPSYRRYPVFRIMNTLTD